MVDWRFLIDEEALASVLPGEFASYLRPLSGALAVFLQGVPPERQEAILADQAALPLRACAPERLAGLARSCPALHKLGQVLARDARLSPELRKHLQELESLPPSVSPEAIADILHEELGPLDRLGVTLLPPALAEASVAVVIPYQDNRGAPRQGVFKVLKPRVVERLGQDLDLLERVGSYLDERCDEFGIPHLDYRGAFEQVREKLQNEVRLDLEQRHLASARVFYGNHPRVLVPALFEHCTPRVTAMERVNGRKVTDGTSPPGRDNDRLAHLLAEALVARPFFSRSAEAPFHGDPHAGNLFLTTDGRLAILDWSLTGSMGERERVALVQIVLAALALDGEQIVAILDGLADKGADRPALQGVVRAWLGRVSRGTFPAFTWLLGLLDEAGLEARLRLGGDLLLFRKTLHTLEGVIADVSGEARAPGGWGLDGPRLIDGVLLAEFVRHWAAEWPRRWLSLPASRAFATRLSNADLLGFVLQLPLAATRYWLERICPRLAT